MFEFYYLLYHFICFTGFFYTLIIYMNNYTKNQQLKYENVETSESFYDVQSIINAINMDSIGIEDTESIIVNVNNTSTSYLNLILLNNLFNKNTKIAVNLTEESDDNLKLFCRKLGFIYFNKIEEYNEKYMNYTTENIREEMIEYSNKTSSTHCFTLLNNEDLMNFVLENMYKFSFTENEQKLRHCEYKGINFYNLLINHCEEDINRIVDELEIEYDNSLNTNSEFTNNYFSLLDFKHDNWRLNLSTLYHQLYINNKTNHKIEEIFDIKNYLFGTTIEMIEDTVPFWMWFDLFKYISEHISEDIEKHIIQTLYFCIINNKTNLDTQLIHNWRLNYNNNTIVIYNVEQLQNSIDNATVIDSDGIYNSISLFLDGDINYEITDDSNSDDLKFSDVILNLEDTNNESLFNNFVFKNHGAGKVCSN
jgi:hypothetical protein